MKEFKIKYSKYDAGNMFLLSLLAPVMVLIVLMLVCPMFGVNSTFFTEASIGFSILSSVVTQGSFIGLFFIYNKLSKVKAKYANSFNFKLGVKNYAILIAITIISVFAMSYFLGLFDALFEVIGYKQPTSLPLPLDNFWWYLLSVLLLAVLPAIGEELIFRGVIYNGLKQKGDKFAIFGSAILFMLLHTSPVQTVYPFLFGLVLAFVVHKTGSIISSMLIHFLNNFIVVTFSFIQTVSGVNLMPQINHNLWILWCILIGIAGLLSIFFLVRLLKKCENKSKIDINNTQDEIKILNEEKTGISKTMIIGIVVSVVLWMFVLFSNF